jgi:protein-disulfide isomerase
VSTIKSARKRAIKAGKTTAQERRVKLQRAEQGEKRWKVIRTVLLVVSVIVGLVVAAIVFSVLWKNRQERLEQEKTQGDASVQITPVDATSDGKAINAYRGVSGADIGLTLRVHSDFQCSGCKSVESWLGGPLNELAARGELGVEYALRSFRDTAMQNTSSRRSVIAASCAADAGKLATYYSVVFDNQPDTMTQGEETFTDEQLRDTFAAASGIEGDDLTTFQTCYDELQTSSYMSQMETLNADVDTTPSYFVNGVAWDISTFLSTQTDEITADEVLASLKQTAGIS